MAEPDVLVVIPSLGQRPETLGEALETCVDLTKLVPSRTIVVLPKGARDARALARAHGAEVVDDPGKGMAQATNRGLASRKTERFYVWLGDDDRLVPEGVAQLVQALGSHPSSPVAYGRCDYIDEHGVVGFTSGAGRLARAVLGWGPNLVPHPGSVIRLDALEEIGLYKPGLRFALDLDMFLSLRSLGSFIYRPVTSAQFRWHSTSLTVAHRRESTREATSVRLSHMSPFLRPLARLWFPLLGIATGIASWQVTRRLRRRDRTNGGLR